MPNQRITKKSGAAAGGKGEKGKGKKDKGKAPRVPADAGDTSSAPVKIEPDTGKTTRMINFLRYRSDPELNKKGVDLKEASDALNVYKSLDANEKRRFVEEFSQSGLNKKSGNWKWITGYKKTLNKELSDTTTVVEQWLTAPQIFKLVGLDYADFEPEKAAELLEVMLKDRCFLLCFQLKTALRFRALPKENEEAFGYTPDRKVHPTHPILSKFFFRGGPRHEASIDQAED